MMVFFFLRVDYIDYIIFIKNLYFQWILMNEKKPSFRYYRRNRDVKKDRELQAFVNELSADGTGPDGGNGQVNHTS